MLLRVICSSPLAAALPAVCVPGLSRLLRAPALSPRNYHVYPAVNDPSPINVLLDPLEGSDQHVATDFQHNKVSRELLRCDQTLLSFGLPLVPMAYTSD